jgi:hypothetical protein
MKSTLPSISTLTSLLVISACITSCIGLTRTEKDRYTITDVDTLETSQVTNQPGDRDNGIIYPSSRTVVKERHIVQEDSVVVREYPDFIRLGIFEGIGLIGSKISGNSTQTGVFGLFPSVDRLFHNGEKDTSVATVFSGGIYRVGIGEWKMHWLGDDPNWTWGVTSFEMIIPDDDPKNTLRGVGVLSIRKRFYFRDKIPYFAITPQFHLSLFPSQYGNLGASADLGSIGGLNLRAYAGYAFGITSMVDANWVAFGYAGLGVSVADFLNREEELETEWKYHEHSSWEIGGGDAFFLGSGANKSLFRSNDPTRAEPAVTGFGLRLLTATIALPVLDYKLTFGTSLAQLLVLGLEEYGLSVLPLRLSYVIQPFANTRFIIEPFAEYNYAPSQFVHAGIRTALPLSDQLAVIAILGFADGSTNAALNFDGFSTTISEFSLFYFGIGVSVLDKLFGREDLRYGKGYPHE